MFCVKLMEAENQNAVSQNVVNLTIASKVSFYCQYMQRGNKSQLVWEE